MPEHTIESYEAALGWGATALEISVVQTSDGVLLCQHDLTFDRTTNLTGKASDVPYSAVAAGRVTIARLGPRWQGGGAPHISRLDEVLTRVGNRAVLCIEAKDDAAFPAMLQLVEKQGLKQTAIVKLHVSSTRFDQARAAGYPLFGYLGSFAETTSEGIRSLTAKLDKATDVMVVPGNEDGAWVPDALLTQAVASAVPVWVFGVHRRSEQAHHLANGAAGVVASSFGYLTNAIPPATTDAWDAGALSSGEMTRVPDSDGDALGWTDLGTVALQRQGGQAFLTLGQFAPLRAPTGPYAVDIEIRVDDVPKNPQSNFTLAFGHVDDRYYEHRQGQLDGYHALLRMDGNLELWAHLAGSPDGKQLTVAIPGPAPTAHTWIPLRLSVSASTLTWSRLDTGARVTSEDSRFRGSYMHVGRSSPDGRVSLRRLRVA